MLIRVLRWGFRWWPFMHGRGWILRLARLLLGRRTIRFDAGGGTLIDGALDDWMIVWLFMRGHERDAPFQHSLELLRPGDLALDVGANFGTWSMLAARRGARVIAFEPLPELAARYRAHAALNGVRDAVVHEAAVGAEEGTLPFFVAREGNSGVSSFARRGPEDDEVRVPVITLDGFRGLEGVKLMKVDVEGAEILAFRGARRFLSADGAPVIFFEVDDELAARFGASSVDVKRLLVEYGYGIYRWRRGALVPVALDEHHEHEDLFAIKP